MSKIVDAPPAPEDPATTAARERWRIRRARRAPPDMPQRENAPLSEWARDVVNGADIDDVCPFLSEEQQKTSKGKRATARRVRQRQGVAREVTGYWIAHSMPMRPEVVAAIFAGNSKQKMSTPKPKENAEHIAHIITAVHAAVWCGYSGDRRFWAAVNRFLIPLGIPDCEMLNEKSLKTQYNRLKRDGELPRPDNILLDTFVALFYLLKIR